jgi:hypothetical protein
MRKLGAVAAATGAAIWIGGAVAWMMGVWVTLPPDTVRVLVLALAAVTGGLLLASGAMIARAARTRSDDWRESALKTSPLLDVPSTVTPLPISEARSRASVYDDRVT